MTINPNEPDPKPLPIHTFAGATSMTGIAQVASDVFAVVVGNYTVAKHLGIPTSFSIWTIDFNYGCPIAEKIASIPEAHALNGMTTVDGTPGVVLVADSDLGALFLGQCHLRQLSHCHPGSKSSKICACATWRQWDSHSRKDLVLHQFGPENVWFFSHCREWFQCGGFHFTRTPSGGSSIR